MSTHHHWDHLGGVRAYVQQEGVTIILQESNHLYYAEVLTVKPWTLKPDRLSLFPPEEVAEGYTFEKVGQQYVLTDGTKVRLREVRNDGQVQLGGRNKKFDLIV